MPRTKYSPTKAGDVYGKWTVVSFSHIDKRGSDFWLCRCSCVDNMHKVVRGQELRNGSSTSCGCFQRSLMTVHGQHSHPIYLIWKNIRQRCNNPHNPSYPRYGGRGITICPDWDRFDRFLADMGPRPKGKSIDRIDNDGPYSKENCRWATDIEQAQNRSGPKLHPISFRGESLPIAEWERRLGFKQGLVKHRLLSGWTVEKALTKPIRKSRRWHSMTS